MQYIFDENKLDKKYLIPYSYLKNLSKEEYQKLTKVGIANYKSVRINITSNVICKLQRLDEDPAYNMTRANKLAMNYKGTIVDKIIVKTSSSFGDNQTLIEFLVSSNISLEKIVYALIEVDTYLNKNFCKRAIKLNNLNDIAVALTKIYGVVPSIHTIINKLHEILIFEKELYLQKMQSFNRHKIQRIQDKEEFQAKKQLKCLSLKLSKKII